MHNFTQNTLGTEIALLEGKLALLDKVETRLKRTIQGSFLFMGGMLATVIYTAAQYNYAIEKAQGMADAVSAVSHTLAQL